MKTLICILIGLSTAACSITTSIKDLKPNHGKTCASTALDNATILSCSNGEHKAFYNGSSYIITDTQYETGKTLYMTKYGDILVEENNSLSLE